MFANSSSVFSQPTTLRNLDYDKGPSPFDLPGFKINGIYELPIGPGRRWMNWQVPVVSKLLEGWQIGGVARIQSGTPLRITGGRTTFNNNIDGKDNGVVLHNLTTAQLQAMMQIRKDPSGVVYYLPQSLINNSLAAFEVAGAPAFIRQRHISARRLLRVNSAPGFFFMVHGRRRLISDLLKKTQITERVNMEFRGAVLECVQLSELLRGNSE